MYNSASVGTIRQFVFFCCSCCPAHQVAVLTNSIAMHQCVIGHHCKAGSPLLLLNAENTPRSILTALSRLVLNHHAKLVTEDVNDEVGHRATPLQSTLKNVVELTARAFRVPSRPSNCSLGLADAVEPDRERCYRFRKSLCVPVSLGICTVAAAAAACGC